MTEFDLEHERGVPSGAEEHGAHYKAANHDQAHCTQDDEAHDSVPALLDFPVALLHGKESHDHGDDEDRHAADDVNDAIELPKHLQVAIWQHLQEAEKTPRRPHQPTVLQIDAPVVVTASAADVLDYIALVIYLNSLLEHESVVLLEVGCVDILPVDQRHMSILY